MGPFNSGPYSEVVFRTSLTVLHLQLNFVNVLTVQKVTRGFKGVRKKVELDIETKLKCVCVFASKERIKGTKFFSSKEVYGKARCQRLYLPYKMMKVPPTRQCKY